MQITEHASQVNTDCTNCIDFVLFVNDCLDQKCYVSSRWPVSMYHGLCQLLISLAIRKQRSGGSCTPVMTEYASHVSQAVSKYASHVIIATCRPEACDFLFSSSG